MSLFPKGHWISPSYASRIIFKWDFKNKSCSTGILLKYVWYVCMHCINSIVCLSSVHPFIGETYMYQTNIRVAIFFAKICRRKDALLYFYLFSMLFRHVRNSTSIPNSNIRGTTTGGSHGNHRKCHVQSTESVWGSVTKERATTTEEQVRVIEIQIHCHSVCHGGGGGELFKIQIDCYRVYLVVLFHKEIKSNVNKFTRIWNW